MYHRERRKMRVLIICGLASLVVALPRGSLSANSTESAINKNGADDNFDNNIVDFDDDYSVKFDKNYGAGPWNAKESFNKESHRYTVIKDDIVNNNNTNRLNYTTNDTEVTNKKVIEQSSVIDQETTTEYSGAIPLELISTTVDPLVSMLESTTEPDLTVIPLTIKPKLPELVIKQTVTLPPSTQIPDTTPDEYSGTTETDVQAQSTTTNEHIQSATTKPEGVSEVKENRTQAAVTTDNLPSTVDTTSKPKAGDGTVSEESIDDINSRIGNTTIQIVKVHTNLTKTDTNSNKNKSNTASSSPKSNKTTVAQNTPAEKGKINFNTQQTKSNYSDVTTENIDSNKNTVTPKPKTNKEPTNPTKLDDFKTNSSQNTTTNHNNKDVPSVPIFTGLDIEEDTEVPEDYYDSKDVVPTSAPKTDALSVIFGLAGSVVESVVESVAERVVPRGIFDLFKRMQRQSEALEAERLRSREENGGLGQFGRGLLKSISTGLSRPLSQLMAGARDIGALDTDRGFVASVAGQVTNVASAATGLADAFKDRVQAIYPGTVWCGDGHAASARSGELGLFFFTDTCCRQHDACKLYIRAGDTKYGLTNTGLFTRSHCGCDSAFRECLRRTNSLVSAQVGLTYFNVLGPQCFRRAHPIVRCLRRTRITGQKCEEYELDYTKPKMWQWFDNETF